MSSGADSPAAREDVQVRRESGILIVTINRPGQRNAVNGAVSAGIASALDLLDSSSDLRVGVLHGSGSAFCAGMDLKAFAAGEQVRDPARGFGGIVERPPAKPLIAAVEGWALGGGSVRASKKVAIESADWPLAAGFQRQRAYLETRFT